MKEKNTTIDDLVRKVYGPRYGRGLSDHEVHEIRMNLRMFAEGILETCSGLNLKVDNLTEEPD